MSPKKRYTEFQQGVMAAAHHLDRDGYDQLRDEVLGLCCLTLTDLRTEYAAAPQ